MTKGLNPALHLDGPTEMMLTMPLQPSDLRLFPGYFQRPAAGGPAPVALHDDIDRDLKPQPHGERCLAELVESYYKWIPPCRILLKKCALNSLEAFTTVCRTAMSLVKLAGIAQPLGSWDARIRVTSQDATFPARNSKELAPRT